MRSINLFATIPLLCSLTLYAQDEKECLKMASSEDVETCLLSLQKNEQGKQKSLEIYSQVLPGVNKLPKAMDYNHGFSLQASIKAGALYRSSQNVGDGLGEELEVQTGINVCTPYVNQWFGMQDCYQVMNVKAGILSMNDDLALKNANLTIAKIPLEMSANDNSIFVFTASPASFSYQGFSDAGLPQTNLSFNFGTLTLDQINLNAYDKVSSGVSFSIAPFMIQEIRYGSNVGTDSEKNIPLGGSTEVSIYKIFYPSFDYLEEIKISGKVAANIQYVGVAQLSTSGQVELQIDPNFSLITEFIYENWEKYGVRKTLTDDKWNAATGRIHLNFSF